MKFKTGLVIGFAVGYVLGAKAGRERYEEIMAGCRSFCDNPKVQDMAARGKAAADLAGAVVGTGLQAASDRVRRHAEADHTGSEDTTS